MYQTKVEMSTAGAADLKSLRRWPRVSFQGLQIEKRPWNHKFASAHDFPKFVKVVAAMAHEPRKSGH
jgi:hypothetical protein